MSGNESVIDNKPRAGSGLSLNDFERAKQILKADGFAMDSPEAKKAWDRFVMVAFGGTPK